MKDKDFYSKAHLIVAAIRILEHHKGEPPSSKDVSVTLSIAVEQVNRLCKKLDEMGIIEAVEGAYGSRLFVRNHLKIEEIEQGVSESSIEDEVKKFKSTRKDVDQKVLTIQAEQEKKQRDLFAEIEKKLKKGMKKKT